MVHLNIKLINMISNDSSKHKKKLYKKNCTQRKFVLQKEDIGVRCPEFHRPHKFIIYLLIDSERISPVDGFDISPTLQIFFSSRTFDSFSKARSHDDRIRPKGWVMPVWVMIGNTWRRIGFEIFDTFVDFLDRNRLILI